jgi:KTSC domain
MERKKLNASNMRSAGYDPKEQILEVEFTSGSVVQYSRVPQEVYRRFMAAPSPRSYFEDNIEESYTAKRVR